HNAKALETAQAVLHDPLMDTHRRFVGTRAAVTAVAYGDRLGLLPAILEGWRKFRPDASQDDPIQAVAYSNALAFAALHAGHTGQVRQIAGQLPSKVDKDSLRLPVAHRLVLIGL